MPATTTPDVDDVLDRALKLTAEQREWVALRLLDSVSPPPNAYDSPEALKAELERRIEDVESGRVKPLSREEVMAYLRKVAAEGGT
jgi:putative addiction module component (TIGR02574 family)